MPKASLRVSPAADDHPGHLAATAHPHGYLVEVRQLPTSADIVRHGRAAAEELGSRAFAICDVERGGERPRLTTLVAHHWPESLDRAGFPAGLDETIAHRAGTSTEPCLWANGETVSLRPLFGEAGGPIELIHPSAAAGIALPVYARQAHCGVVLFSGLRRVPPPEVLCEVHSRCFTLYSACCRMRQAEASAPPSISRRERECLKLAANGCTSEEIAKALRLSVHTANQYLTNSAQKLDAMNRVHAVAKALRLGLID